jgi:aminocarboxymuconate-semialdehyde decarboxylase
LKIDVYNHLFPPHFFRKMCEVCCDEQTLKRYRDIPMLVDLDLRFRAMDQFGDYRQIISLASPPIEALAGPQTTPELARIANDGLAEYCRRYPDRFPGFIAGLPMNHPDAAIKELHRAVGELGSRGIQLFSNAAGKPLDRPEFAPLFEAMAAYDLPIWLHPARGPDFPDYQSETRSRYEIWWALGWPFETSVAMARLVFAGLFDRHPDIKIIAHHMGGMIPYFEGRIGAGWDQLGKRTADEDCGAVLRSLRRRPYDYFKMFLADTALFGAKSATRCGLDFFGSDRVLFASDSPFDPEGGTMYIRETIRVLEALDLSQEDRRRIYCANAVRLLNLKSVADASAIPPHPATCPEEKSQ